MESMRYEIKEEKHIAFRVKDQQRFTRAKAIGEKYTEESIRIELKHEKNMKITLIKIREELEK